MWQSSHDYLSGRVELFGHLPVDVAVGVGEVEQRLYHLAWKDAVLLPEVEDPDDLALLLLAALVQVVEGDLGVLGEPDGKDVLVGPELVPRLTHDAVDDVEAGGLVLRLTFLVKQVLIRYF